MSEIQQENICLPTRSFQETLNSGMCGPASLKIVLDYFGLEVSEAELGTLCGTSATFGTNDKSITRTAEHFGFQARIQNLASFDNLHFWLRQDIPPIVDWFTRGRTDCDESGVPDGHYSVVSGLTELFVILDDPELGKKRQISRSDFERVWFDFQGDRLHSADDLILRQAIAIYPADKLVSYVH